MLALGAKGWVKKYFQLVKDGKINLELSYYPSEKQHLKHIIFSHTGIVFGYPSTLIFAKNFEKSKWTIEERLKCLLFESHLYTYISNGGQIATSQQDFYNALLDFYEHHSVFTYTKLFTFFLKESDEEKIEKILEKRTEIRKNLLDNALWINYFSNTFVYLDVILFDEFLRTKRTLALSNYEVYTEMALKAMILAVNADGVIDKKEKKVFDVFLASAKIEEKKKHEIESLFNADVPLSNLSKSQLYNELLRRYLLDISVFTILTNHEVHPEEMDYLQDLCKHLAIEPSSLNETIVIVENFVLKHNKDIAFLHDNSSIEKLYSNISKRWIKILGRNKDKLVQELVQSKELVALIKKSTKHELSKEEKEKVKTQFLDIVKSMPALAIFLLPGGALLLPIVLKIIPDLMPSAFRDNEVKD